MLELLVALLLDDSRLHMPAPLPRFHPGGAENGALADRAESAGWVKIGIFITQVRGRFDGGPGF
jgi:hypothetical protein